ncbi:MAG: non-homologous end-joining DNA ligase [Candidatus Micrarchaeia archaeon]
MSLWDKEPVLVKPMLAFPSKPFDSKDFLMEIKYDGTRCIAYIDTQARRVMFLNRRMIFFQARYPEFADFYKQVDAKRAILDGELVVFHNGRPDFNLLQEREQSGEQTKIEILSKLHPATYVVFDILHKDGEDLLDKKLLERKEILDKTLTESSYAIKSSFIFEKGIELFNKVKEQGLEGIMAKRIDSPYVQKRSKDWLKIKALNTIDAVIIGFTSSEQEKLSALLLGLYSGGQLVYIGRVGTGFSEEEREALFNELSKDKLKKPIVEVGEAEPGKTITYTSPRLVAEVRFMEMTKEHMLRAPAFLRLRNDKKPEDCTMESNVEEGT